MKLFVYFTYPKKSEKWYFKLLAWLIALFSGGKWSHTGAIIEKETKYHIYEQTAPVSKETTFDKDELGEHFKKSFVLIIEIKEGNKNAEAVETQLKANLNKRYSIWQLIYIMLRVLIIPSLLGVPQIMKRIIKSINKEYVCSEYTNNFVYEPLKKNTKRFIYQLLTELDRNLVSPAYQVKNIINYMGICEDKKMLCELEECNLTNTIQKNINLFKSSIKAKKYIFKF